MKKIPEGTDVGVLNWQMLKILWTEHVTNEEVLCGIGNTKNLLLTIKKRWLKFLGHNEERRLGEFHTCTACCRQEKQWKTTCKYQTTWEVWLPLKQKGVIKKQELLWTRKGRKSWRVIIVTNCLRRHTEMGKAEGKLIKIKSGERKK